MKSYNSLWPDVVSWENLILAYQRCRRRKRYRRGAVEFDYCWETNLLQLQAELICGDYHPGAYRNFEIREPKTRTISAAPFRDRVVHHALINVIGPILERSFIFDSYACRSGKGTHRAVRRCQYYMRRHSFYFKSDIVKFFPNVDHEILLQLIQSRIADQSVVQLIERILESGKDVLQHERSNEYFPGDDLIIIKALWIANRQLDQPILCERDAESTRSLCEGVATDWRVRAICG